MASFEEKYYLANAGLMARLKRDLRLLQDSLAFILLWASRGRRLRADYRRARDENSEVILDDLQQD